MLMTRSTRARTKGGTLYVSSWPTDTAIPTPDCSPAPSGNPVRGERGTNARGVEPRCEAHHPQRLLPPSHSRPGCSQGLGSGRHCPAPRRGRSSCMATGLSLTEASRLSHAPGRILGRAGSEKVHETRFLKEAREWASRGCRGAAGVFAKIKVWPYGFRAVLLDWQKYWAGRRVRVWCG